MSTTFQVDIVHFILYFGIVTGLILYVLLRLYRRQFKGSFWLSLFVLSLPLNFLNYTLVPYLYQHFEYFTLVRIPILYGLGLLYWLYVSTVLKPNFRFRRKHWWYLSIFFLDVAYSFGQAIYIRFWALESKAKILFSPVEFLFHEGGAIIYNLAFLIAAFQIARSKQKEKKSIEHTVFEKPNQWIYQISLIYFAVMATWISYYIWEWMVFPDYLLFQQYYPLWIMDIVIVLVLGYKGVIAPDQVFRKLQENTPIVPKYQHSTLSDKEISNLSHQLKVLMEEQKLYLDAQLKLADLSKALSIQNHQLSQVISQGLQTNFYDLVNQYRITSVKIKLADESYQHKSILSLAFESGFNSKTAFNVAFRKFTNTSPSAYRKSILRTS